MCLKCELQIVGRRKMLGLGGLALAGTLTASRRSFAADDPTTTVTVDEAIAKLKAGNDKYVQAPEVCARDLKSGRAQFANLQTPWVTVLSCSDSRVLPEVLFGGLGIGELFVVRNAGNTIDTASLGTIEYGAAVLKTPLLLVLGHERCGAITSACEMVEKKVTFPGSIGKMIETIVPAAKSVEKASGDFVENTVRANAKQSAAKLLSESKIIADLVKAGKTSIAAARYDLDDGRVEYLT
jgi:carbonic anhydrase